MFLVSSRKRSDGEDAAHPFYTLVQWLDIGSDDGEWPLVAAGAARGSVLASLTHLLAVVEVLPTEIRMSGRVSSKSGRPQLILVRCSCRDVSGYLFEVRSGRILMSEMVLRWIRECMCRHVCPWRDGDSDDES